MWEQGTVAGVRRILRSARAGDGEEERRDGTGSMPTQGDAARYQTADLATAAGSSRYDADPVAQGAADRDGMAGHTCMSSASMAGAWLARARRRRGAVPVSVTY